MRWRRAGLIFIIAVSIRLFPVFLGADDLWNDELDYERIAENIVRYHEFTEYPGEPYSYRPPGYPFFLAALYSVLGANHLAVKLFQVMISAVTAVMIYALGCLILEERQAFIASLVWGVYPTIAAYSGYLYSETLFFLLFVGMLCFLVSAVRQDKLICKGAFLVASGMFYGAAALTREVLVAFVPFLGIWLIWVMIKDHGGKGIVFGALFFVGVSVVVMPWVIRNYRVHHAFVPVSTNGGCNVYYGNNPDTPIVHSWEYSSVDQQKFDSKLFQMAGNDPVLKSKLGYKLALEHIIDRPDLFLLRAVGKVLDTWEIDRVPIARLKDGYYRLPKPVIALGIGIVALAYVSIMFLGVLGMIRSERNRWWWLGMTFIVGFCLIHAVVYGHTRYRLPLMVFIALFVPFGLATPKGKREIIPLLALGLIWARQIIVDLHLFS